MGNWTRLSGVYSNMHRLPLLLVCWFTAMAQQPPAQDPLDAAIQAAYAANGHFQEAVAAREQARELLRHMPASAERFGIETSQVAQLFQNVGRNAEARAILEDGLARIAALGKSHPPDFYLLSALERYWENDGNLLKVVGYLEQQTAAPAAPPKTSSGQPLFVSGRVSSRIGDPGAVSRIQAYIRLAVLYRKLGRPDAVATVAAKVRELGSTGQSALAGFYEQLGQLDQAAAVYREMAENAKDPQTRVNAWQNLANLAARQQHFTDAAAATQDAIAAAQMSDAPGVAGQTFWMRQNLARYLGSAGAIDQADQIFQQLVQQSQGGPQQTQSLFAYAQYLGETARGAQGMKLLEDYLADNPNPDAQQNQRALQPR
jgi:tetratricopeptide (TPR) repeat protein